MKPFTATKFDAQKPHIVFNLKRNSADIYYRGLCIVVTGADREQLLERISDMLKCKFTFYRAVYQVLNKGTIRNPKLWVDKLTTFMLNTNAAYSDYVGHLIGASVEIELDNIYKESK